MRPVALSLAGLALVVVSAGSAYLTFAASESGSKCTAVADGPMECVSYSRSLVEEQGAWILTLLAIPIALACLVLWLIARRADKGLEVALAALFFAFCLVAIFSIGAIYLPGALLLLLAAAFDRRPRVVSL